MIELRNPPLRTDRVGMLGESGTQMRWPCSRCGRRMQVRPETMNHSFMCRDCKSVEELCAKMAADQEEASCHA
jgi:hypothetical protein